MKDSARAQLPRSVPLIEHMPQVVPAPLPGISAQRPIPTRTIAGSQPPGPPERRSPQGRGSPPDCAGGRGAPTGLWTRLRRFASSGSPDTSIRLVSGHES